MTKTPLVLELTPEGKTLACFYSHCRAMVIARLLAIMGDPELVCPGDGNPDVLWFVWAHQDMPDKIRKAAEEMSTANLLTHLGFDKPEGGS